MDGMCRFVVSLEKFGKTLQSVIHVSSRPNRYLLNFNIAYLPVDASPTNECRADGDGLLCEIKAIGKRRNPLMDFSNSQSLPLSFAH